MSWEDDDFERDLIAYSEIETLSEPQEDLVPATIQRYQQRIQYNNTASIFDVNYSLPTNGDEDQAAVGSFDDVLENNNSHEALLKDDDKVIRVICGRGRGGRNVFHKPGGDPGKAKLPDDDQDVIQQLRKVAPIGYGNEITESAVRAHHKAKMAELENTSPAKSKSSSPSSLRKSSPIEPKQESDLESSKSLNTTNSVVSRTSTPSSGSSGVASSDYFTTNDNIVSDSSHIADSSNGSINVEDSEDDESVSDESEVDTVAGLPPAPAVSPAPVVTGKPIPLSEMLRLSREEYKKSFLEKLNSPTHEAKQKIDDELATQRKIEEILKQDRAEEELRRIRLSDASSSSSVTSASSREDRLSWRRHTNSPPRYPWAQKTTSKRQGYLNINSTLDFPSLK